MPWNYLHIDLALGRSSEVACGPGGLIYEAARLDVQERLDELTGRHAAFRGANRAWRQGAPEGFVMAMGRYAWCLYEENPAEPSQTTARRVAQQLIMRIRDGEQPQA